MSYRAWVHNCSNKGIKRTYEAEEICPECGERGIYDGWHYSVVEYMCMYTHGTKLPPYGPHRPFADILFFPSFKKCPKCKDTKKVPTGDGDFTDCDLCPRELYVFKGTPEEFEAIRKQVLTAYPSERSGQNKEPIPPTTEPAPEPPPPPNEPEPQHPSSPDASPTAFFTRPADDSAQAREDMAEGIANAINKAFEQHRNFQITDHRSKYTYLLWWWDKRGGTFNVKMDGIELRAISHPTVSLAVLFIESPFVASVIVNLNPTKLGVQPADLKKFRKALPRPDHFEEIGDSAYLSIDDSFTQKMFDQLMDALAVLDKAIKPMS
jgi:hypothetical protein